MTIQNGFLIGSETISIDNVTPITYTGFKFNGNCIIDSILIRNYEQTDTEIINDSVTIGVEPDWTPDVTFLASMNNTIDGGNITGMTVMPDKWSLYRHEKDGDKLYKVCDVDMSINSWIDYKVEGNKTYEYYLYSENDSQISSPIVTSEIKTTFWGWYLIDSIGADSNDPVVNEAVESYKFDLNLQSSKIVTNNDMTLIKSYSQFDNAVILDRNFRSSDFSAWLIPQLDSSGYDFEGITNFRDLLDNLKLFLHNKQNKYLKTRDGDIIKVITEGSNSTVDYQYQDNLYVNGNQPAVVNIYWTEIGKVYDEDNNI